MLTRAPVPPIRTRWLTRSAPPTSPTMSASAPVSSSTPRARTTSSKTAPSRIGPASSSRSGRKKPPTPIRNGRWCRIRTAAEPVAFDVYLNVAVGGILTGLVYGLMALGLSVIFGVVRVVNFAHGEMMSIAMYIAVVLFSGFHLDPLIMLIPIAAVMFVFGYVLQAGLINPFITRPEHSQFLLLVALAIIIVNVLLIIFGPDARTIQTYYAYDSFQLGALIVDASK